MGPAAPGLKSKGGPRAGPAEAEDVSFGQLGREDVERGIDERAAGPLQDRNRRLDAIDDQQDRRSQEEPAHAVPGAGRR